nr:hypothetical protein [Tanacetum cinerariifolium]
VAMRRASSRGKPAWRTQLATACGMVRAEPAREPGSRGAARPAHRAAARQLFRRLGFE